LKPEQHKNTHFGLLRHAETVWNRDKKIQGLNDSPLTPEGLQQAQKWGELLSTQSWDRMLVSDIGRAVQTATGINGALKIPMTIEKRLREQDWGDWTGQTIREIKENDQLITGTSASKKTTVGTPAPQGQAAGAKLVAEIIVE